MFLVQVATALAIGIYVVLSKDAQEPWTIAAVDNRPVDQPATPDCALLDYCRLR